MHRPVPKAIHFRRGLVVHHFWGDGTTTADTTSAATIGATIGIEQAGASADGITSRENGPGFFGGTDCPFGHGSVNVADHNVQARCNRTR